ncbi:MULTISPECIES: hypothetical protein [unclassified Ruegeria]|uniref:hypothetical protein n=1 Tax=unclassified Ruegeria TaxID=2625375 RepID=UPI001489AF13|nr:MULTISPECIES: hypothetical protein [unclassified Ruegeria]
MDPSTLLSARLRKARCKKRVNASPGFTQFVEADPHPWTGRSNLELYEQTRVANKGHAVTLLWAELPEDEEDGGLKELGIPGFR